MSTHPKTLYEFEARLGSGELQPLSQYQGKVLLIVNTASACGFTPQYEGLESLYQQFRERGFEILAFPCNQFGGQEPGTDTEIAQFCSLNYKTSFPLFSKIEVNGESAHPLYVYLKSCAPGIFGTEAIKWNFTKFLIDKKGNPIARFAPQTKPQELAPQIDRLLNS